MEDRGKEDGKEKKEIGTGERKEKKEEKKI